MILSVGVSGDRMKTFSITTLGCRVNHYESEQLAALLRARGLVQAAAPDRADVRVVHTCSVTVQAASKSRQSVRRLTRLPVLSAAPAGERDLACTGGTDPVAAVRAAAAAELSLSDTSSITPPDSSNAAKRSRVIVTGCWATSHPQEAAALRGVDAVLGHHQNVERELSRLLTQWEAEDDPSRSPTSLDRGAVESKTHAEAIPPEPSGNDKWMIRQAGTRAEPITRANEPHGANEVNVKLETRENPCEEVNEVGAMSPVGMMSLPQLGERQIGHQRAFLKVQDGCDAHCTYCIIPQLRPALWSKPIGQAVAEARRLVEAGHVELVLTGIFLGAYGQPTALRRRQTSGTAEPLAELIDALCTRVPGLGRLRMSSLEPGDLTEGLIDVLRSHRQVVPHFRLPLQSGSDALLRRMNRQYGRQDFLEMAARVNAAFDRPAITTDIIVGFPGETDDEFERTVEVVEQVGFIHVHAFSYSPRPKTAAARWTKDHVRGPIVNRRIDRLRELAAHHSLEFRRRFLGETVEVLVERPSSNEREMEALVGYQHGRCERYFAVHFESAGLRPGTLARVRVDRVTPTRTFGTLLEARR
jgi:MiaB/RimO family radical SAM methylthiotransferase